MKMEVKSYLPKFESHTTPVNREAEIELFRNLYKEKTDHMNQVTVLNFYGPTGTGKTHLLRTIYNMKETPENTTGAKPETTPYAGTTQPAAIYCNIPRGIATIISQIIKQSSEKYGFNFPLSSICLYILSRYNDEETGSAFPLSDLRKAAAYIENEPEFQYIKQALDRLPLDQTGFQRLYSRLLMDEQAPRSLRQLAEARTGLLEYLFSWPIRLLNLRYRRDRIHSDITPEQKQKRRLEYLSAFFPSFFASDMEENLKGFVSPFVILLDGIDTIFAHGPSYSGQKEKEKWLCGTAGLLTTIPKTLWVFTSSRKLNWEKDYLPDWRGALIQKAVTIPKISRKTRPYTPDKLTAPFWEQQKNTMDEKVQCVLQGLGFLNFDIALKACAALLEEYKDIPRFESECRSRIMEYIKKTNKDLLVASSLVHLPVSERRKYFFCYDPDSASENKESVKYKFKAFYFSQQYYTALINRIRLGTVPFADSFRHGEQTYENKLASQIQTVESLIDSTKQFVSGNNSVQQRLLAFYFTAVTPQVLDWIDLGLYSVAEGILEKLKAVIAEDHPLLSGAYELCYAYLQKVRDNNTAEAIQRMEAIYKDVKETLGKEDPAVVYLLNILGYVRGFMPGQEVTAYRERRQCVRILQNTLGKTAKETIRTISLLSPHLADTGRKEASELVSKICLAKAEYLFGENDLVTLQCKARYAFRLKAKRNYREAADLQEAVANQYEAIYGNHNPKTLTALKALANTLYSLGNETELDAENETVITNYAAKEKELRLREAVLKHYQSILQNEQTEKNATVHPFIRDAVINVCDSMYNCNRPLEEIIEFAKKHLGANDPGLISVLHNAAIDDSENGESERAVTMIKQAIELRKKLGIETYAGLKSYIACRVSLAWFYAETGTAEEQDGEPNLFIAIPKDCETLLAMAEKDNNPDLLNECKLFTANRLYNLAHIALYYYSEHVLALELIEKAISLKLSVSAVEDEELGDYLELKREIDGEVE